MSLKPIHLYTHAGGPNPWKLAILLSTLQIPYTQTFVPFSDIKKPEYLAICPNGRVPAIVDPNTNVTMWESGAIMEYLVETYDKEGEYWVKEGGERWVGKSWLFFQMSGQGPYFGQAIWFTRYHSEKIDSAKLRYINEIYRVFSVLDTALEGKSYLVAEKCTIADLSFIPWNYHILRLEGVDVAMVEKSYPRFWEWHHRLLEREAVKKVMSEREGIMAEEARGK
ncbi:Glutathione S-transferase (GST), C-terminal [Glarea lozoyensis ATCC 20868]|uniref:Glutathione S-transferase (GST), C-terminal n=1 Tax=Glarea lozoyensis (strain ATCC 20868 / MF5171) TaxID=1116229 RepID=S3CXD4_GLAL2|nr:Glutathione S-transferase (GST), C-terminal [Glarea lozoyensis ATCC 20868]EPE31002.1 Glutathione S-transferase (GST), C-terminal [Glarea lozoyensis ATCC 20868]